MQQKNNFFPISSFPFLISSLSYGFIHTYSCRNRCVERIYLSEHRQTDEKIAVFLHKSAHAEALRADNKSHTARKIGLVNIIARHIRAEYPHTCFFKLSYSRSKIRHSCDLYPACSTCGGLVYRVVERCTSAFRYDYPVCARSLSSSDYRTKIMRVLYLVTDNNKRSLAFFTGSFKYVLNGRILGTPKHSRTPLMHSTCTHVVKLLVVYLLDYNITFLSQ